MHIIAHSCKNDISVIDMLNFKILLSWDTVKGSYQEHKLWKHSVVTKTK